MINVTRINGKRLYVNAELIRYVEGTPDCVITMMDGTKIIAKEPPETIIERIIEYRRSLLDQRCAGVSGE